MSAPLFFEHDKTIFREMMSHPALFTHPQPKTITIIGDEDSGILHEVLKHETITQVYHLQKNHALIHPTDARVEFYCGGPNQWIEQLQSKSMDILINTGDFSSDQLQTYYQALNSQGILIQPSESIFHLSALKSLAEDLQSSGFSDLQILHFPQPHFVSGWRSALMAQKQGMFRRAREKAIYNRSFTTQYYNFDTHRAATALPEFIRKEWIL